MSLIFADSFDHYTRLLSPNGKYDIAGAGSLISMGLGASRTGPGCLAVNSGAYGPGKVIRPTLDVLIASAYFTTLYGLIYRLGVVGPGSWECELLSNPDRSLGVSNNSHYGGDFPTLANSAPGVIQYGAYNNLAMRCTCNAVTGTVSVWCNGVLVIHLVNVNTNWSNPTLNYVNGFELMGPGGGVGTCFHDDLYVLDCTDAVNNDYLGPLRIYESAPTADGAVLWTPSVGASNFANVDTIPPDGTLYNSDGTIGHADQYVHPLNGAVPANSQLFAVQHSMDLTVDSGARAVTSDVGGILNADAVALAAGYVIQSWPYDQDPITAAPWLASSFPVLAGPSVTA
jgi:hypothetical protein